MAQPPALGNSVLAGLAVAQPQQTSSLRSCQAAPIAPKTMTVRTNMPSSQAISGLPPGCSFDLRTAGPPQALPISKPAAKTRAPPRTTWKIALLHGVSIQWFWIQAMAQSSTKTTAMATEVAMVKSGIR